jgi:hypothetical protein
MHLFAPKATLDVRRPSFTVENFEDKYFITHPDKILKHNLLAQI